MFDLDIILDFIEEKRKQEQETNKNSYEKVEILAKNRTFLSQELERAKRNVQTLENKIAQCTTEIISLLFY